jgi:hypothetical protein
MRADERSWTAPLDAETVHQLCGDISDETVIAVPVTGTKGHRVARAQGSSRLDLAVQLRSVSS